MLKDVAPLESERLRVRPATVDDAPALFDAVCRHDEVTKYLTWRPHSEQAETEEFLRLVEGWNAQGQELTCAVVFQGDPVGLFTMRHPEAGAGIELGFCLGPAVWRKGVMSEVLSLALPALERYCPGGRIWATTDIDNVASMRLLEATGFTRVGVERGRAVHPNISTETRDCVTFEW